LNYQGTTLDNKKFWWPIAKKYREGKVKKAFLKMKIPKPYC